MGVVFTCLIIFAVFIAAAFGGLALHRRLPPEHKSDIARTVIGQVSGLVSLLLALVLGTLIGVSFAYFSTQKTGLETFSAQILRLDQALGQYGPETKPLRDRLKEGIVKGYGTFWAGGAVDPSAPTVAGPLANAKAVDDFLANLHPQTDAQKAALATANTCAGMVEQSRLMMSLQVVSKPVSPTLIAVLAFWTAALFFGIGLFAEPNALVHSALTFGAVSNFFDLRARHALHRPLQSIAGSARTSD